VQTTFFKCQPYLSRRSTFQVSAAAAVWSPDHSEGLAIRMARVEELAPRSPSPQPSAHRTTAKVPVAGEARSTNKPKTAPEWLEMNIIGVCVKMHFYKINIDEKKYS